MSAEVLRRAAALMRRRAASAGSVRYGFSSTWTTPNTMLTKITRDGAAVAESRGQGEFLHDMNHLSYWSPAVALAVADLLDALAAERDAEPFLPKPFDAFAVDLARAYLGEQP